MEILGLHCHASLWHSVVAWVRYLSVPENYGVDTIIIDYFYRSFFLTPPLWVLELHINGIIGISIHITESKIHISYSENHDSTLMLVFHYHFCMYYFIIIAA